MPLKHVLEIQQASSGRQIVAGIEGKFIQLISKSLDFQYRLVVPEDREWGRMKNGTWTGLIGMVVRGEVDMALTYLSITEERMKAVNFSTPYVLEDLTFATNLPGFLNGMTYLRPFQLDVWLCCLGLLLIIPAVFCFLLQQKYGYFHLFIKFYGSCFKQPLLIKETAFHIRLLFGCWCFLSMFISLSYTALLASFVTLPTIEDPLRNLQELAEAVAKGNYKCFIAKGSSDLEMILNSENESIRQLGAIVEDLQSGGTMPVFQIKLKRVRMVSNSRDKVDKEFKMDLIASRRFTTWKIS
ncbi:glutamate receptor ionotropic, kainate 4-like [Uloborus diversus]|uniref:glutamate receptor ionotropic, kainate 4-like n=1 Tax=Uloborus diversus TaxID=327109 RepID=UPI00240A007D|nr:glutamate receptor ionotropic, kainate 4-like [Uloborus diversus]